VRATGWGLVFLVTLAVVSAAYVGGGIKLAQRAGGDDFKLSGPARVA
jgi:hypothetical protein